MVHLQFTGKVSFGAIVAGAFFAWFLQEVPFLTHGGEADVATVRWLALVFFCFAIFMIGQASNRRKVIRRSPDGKMRWGSPNTILHVPLQYWALIYFFGLSCAIAVWQTKAQ